MQGQTYPLSHDLAALLDMLSVGGVYVADFDALVDYTPYVVRLRYATADPGVRPPDRPRAIEQVETLLATGRRQLAVASWLTTMNANLNAPARGVSLNRAKICIGAISGCSRVIR